MNKVTTYNIRLSNRERLSIFSDLATMLAAGIPILECLDSMLSDAKGHPKKALRIMRDSLDNGRQLSQALERMPQAFDSINVNLIKAAEIGGTLETTLKDMVVATKKEMAFSDQLKSTMVYPLFVMAVFTGIVVLMLTFVIPRVAKVFGSLNEPMPAITKFMIKASNIFNAHWLLIVIAFGLLIILAVFLIKTYTKNFLKLLFKLPFLKQLGINIDLTRFTRSFGLLLDAGVDIVEALQLSRNVVTNQSIEKVITQMIKDVDGGNPLVHSLSDKNSAVPPIMVRSIKTAETSGTLVATLGNLNEYFDDQVTQTIKVLSSLIEPVLILVVGILVGSLMISIIIPIYSMISNINATGG